MLASQMKARELRNRLYRPINGRLSESTEVVAPHVAARMRQEAREKARRDREMEELFRKRAEAQRARDDFERQKLLDPTLIAAEEAQAATVAEAAASEQDEAPPPLPRIVEIQKAVCEFYQKSRVDLLSMRRTADVVLPRQVGMYLCKQLTLRSLPEIGRRFGGKDHTTVLHAVRKIAAKLDAGDPELADEIAVIKQRLGV